MEAGLKKQSVLTQTRRAILVGALLLLALYLISRQSYLLFHSLIELFTIIVAAGIFVIAWNARGFLSNNFLLFIAVASVFVALLDLLHTLAYEGMGVFGGNTANLATQLWIAGRYLQAFSWLFAPYFLGRKLKLDIVVGAYALVTAWLLLFSFYWGIFPPAYLAGTGLTLFKKISEYAVSLIFLASIGMLVYKRREFDPLVWQLLIISLIVTIGAEIAFTSYASVYGEANLIGHLLRLLAFYLLYKAIIETGLVKPYAILLRDLKRSDDQLREYAVTLQQQNQQLLRTENQLREDGAALKARNEELDAYAHTVAHDLKNPLSAIIAASDVINEVANLTPKELREYLQSIKVTAFEMNDIIDSLLLLSEVGRIEAPLGPVDTARVLSKVGNRLKYFIRERRGRIILPDEWPAVIGYEPWVEQVWANYISNAMKYGGQSPCVELGATPEPDGMIRFWVRDTGPGIPIEAQAALFTPFRQLHKLKRDGHGLGLSIVLRIVEKLGGKVGVESQVGKGSTFYFALPAATPQTSPAAHARRAARGTT